jgi:Fic family protein
MARASNTFKSITVLRQRYFKALPGKESLVKIINETEIPEHVYNSNAIENSTLSLEETEKILLEIDLARFVSEREVYEAKNLALVMGYVENKAKTTELSKDLMLLLHKMLISNINSEIAGRFRTPTEWVRVGNYIAANPAEIEMLLNTLLTELKSNPKETIIKRIARLHLAFEHIHPFCDGNGRIGRIINNFVLLREDYVPINIAFTSRAEYYEAFKAFDAIGDTTLMEIIVGRALSNSYNKRLAYLEGKKIVTLNEYAKKNKESHSNLINKAQRQTIPAFLEKGIWKIAADFAKDIRKGV